jgi:hypothetical protein
MSRTIIFSAPAGWGKTTKAEELRKEFGCVDVIDDWTSRQPIKVGYLHLTTEPVVSTTHPRAEVIRRGWKD